MKGLIVGLMAVVVLGLVEVRQVEAVPVYEFTYSGMFDRDAYDHAGIEGGAVFTLNALFPHSPYADDGSGQPFLTATSSTFTIVGAPVAGSNGEYLPDRPVVMYPTLGGKMGHVKFVHAVTGWTTGPRLLFFFEGLSGGDGLGATIGQMPSVSHFGTCDADSTLIALPWNIPYNVINPSVNTNIIPEPSTIVIWSLLGALAITAGWWRRRRKA